MTPLRRLAIVLLAAACATAGPTAEPARTVQGAPSPAEPWAVTARMHVDLWLHGFAMVQADTTLVPYFARGYRERMLELKRRGNATTTLDVETDRLRQGLTDHPVLVNAQFLPLHFSSLEATLRAVDLFLAADGEPRRATSQQEAAIIGALAQYFPGAAQRDWLRVFRNALRDEQARWYESWWMQRQRELAPVLARVDSLWQGETYPRMRGYLNGTGGAEGTIYLSIPLDGEGRALSGRARAENIVAVSFPESPGTAVEAIYVYAHEVAGRVVGLAVGDNVTPSEQRAGVAERHTAMGLVRGGALLLQRVQPALVEGYMRHYLRAAGVAVPPSGGAALEQAFARAFPLPPAIASAIARQLDVVLGGI